MNLKNKIVLGCAQSDQNYGLNKKNKFNEVFDLALKFNVKYFDTSATYKNSSEYILKTSKVFNSNIISKTSFEGTVDRNYKEKVINEINKILNENKTKNIYALLLHNPILPLNEKKWPIIYKVLKHFKKKGFIKKIGISVYSRFELDQALEVFKPDIVQFPLNIFNQSFGDLKYLKSLKQKKIELHARSIFLQGLLLQYDKNIDNYFSIWSDEFDKFKKFLKKNKITRLRACINYVSQFNIIDKFIIGADNRNHLLNIFKEVSRVQKKYDFSELSVKDEYLTDPRFWDKKNLKKNKNISTWYKTRRKILNGGMLLSKRPDQFLLGGWPSFFKKAYKCFIVDNLNQRYLDFSLMGVGTNILGYANKEVNDAVKKIINSGNSSTLNSENDLLLTNKLIEIHPWAKMATYARTGAEANAIAIRIARAYSGKDEIAICGYHGWHDWYLSSNLKNAKNLNNIHLPGLSTIGIPKKLKGITHPFKYNDIKGFKELIDNNLNIGVVFMEVQRNQKPKVNFLDQIRKITRNKKIVLIFDECTSGFRETFGGLHLKYKVNPDIAVFGKALGNGVPITSVIGSDEVMKYGFKSFISSTFWTDSLGPSAAIATLAEMKKKKSWIKISQTGKKIKKFWKYLSKKHNVPILIEGLDALPSFKFNTKMHPYLKTFLTQEMLRKKILATNSVYCCIDHDKYLKIYFYELEKVFIKINYFFKGENIMNFLNHPVSKSGFHRLN